VREPGGEEERGIEEAEVVLSGRRGDDAGKNGESKLPLPGWVGLGGACVLLSFAGFGPLDTHARVRLERLRSTSQEAGSCDPKRIDESILMSHLRFPVRALDSTSSLSLLIKHASMHAQITPLIHTRRLLTN
jgi:hypothetical protein